MNTEPVEITTQFATVVDDIPAAWAFIMGRVDKVGPAPQVTISPIWWHDEGDGMRRFEVSVSGMVAEGSPS